MWRKPSWNSSANRSSPVAILSVPRRETDANAAGSPQHAGRAGGTSEKLQREKPLASADCRQSIEQEIEVVSKRIRDLDTEIQTLMNQAQLKR